MRRTARQIAAGVGKRVVLVTKVTDLGGRNPHSPGDRQLYRLLEISAMYRVPPYHRHISIAAAGFAAVLILTAMSALG
jgi:hypothetical protein